MGPRRRRRFIINNAIFCANAAVFYVGCVACSTPVMILGGVGMAVTVATVLLAKPLDNDD